jgi:hypothetical protein
MDAHRKREQVIALAAADRSIASTGSLEAKNTKWAVQTEIIPACVAFHAAAR